MKVRKKGWLILNTYVVQEIIAGKIPVYNLPLQSEESENKTEDFIFQINKPTSRAEISGKVDLGNGQFMQLVLDLCTRAEGIGHKIKYSISEVPEQVDKVHVMD